MTAPGEPFAFTPEQLQRRREIAAAAPPLTPWQRDILARIYARARAADVREPAAA